MPAPLILGGIALAGGLMAAKAKKNKSKALDILQSAQEAYESAIEKIETRKTEVSESLAQLGQLRVSVETSSMKRFVALASKINNVAYRPIELGSGQVFVDPPKIQEIKLSTVQTEGLIRKGASAGAMAAIGAGGIVVSAGALVAAPVFAISGFKAAKQSERLLTEATMQESELLQAVEQIENGLLVLEAIDQRIEELGSAIQDLDRQFVVLLEKTENIIQKKYSSLSSIQKFWLKLRRSEKVVNFKKLSTEERSTYTSLTALGYAIYALIKIKIIDNEGNVTEESSSAIQNAQELLRTTK